MASSHIFPCITPEMGTLTQLPGDHPSAASARPVYGGETSNESERNWSFRSSSLPLSLIVFLFRLSSPSSPFPRDAIAISTILCLLECAGPSARLLARH